MADGRAVTAAPPRRNNRHAAVLTCQDKKVAAFSGDYVAVR